MLLETHSSVVDLFEKKLYFLIPFYIFTHEQQFPKYNQDEEKLEELKTEYVCIMQRLDEAVKNGELPLHQMKSIVEMSKLVLRNIAKKYEKVKEGVDAIMGGRVLEYESKTIYNEGVAQGRAEGEQKLTNLMEKLFSLNRTKDAQKALADLEYREKLYMEFGIA